MKQNELRIGNYVFLKSKSKYYEILSGQEIDTGLDSQDFEPIPLTEEWLLKFGFEKLKTKNRFLADFDFEIEKQGNFFAYVLWGGESAPHLTQFIGHCEYVHQLQNLYFALTNEELNTNL